MTKPRPVKEPVKEDTDRPKAAEALQQQSLSAENPSDKDAKLGKKTSTDTERDSNPGITDESQSLDPTALEEPRDQTTSGATLRTSDRLERMFGVIVLLIAFGGFGLWAGIAPLDSAAVAPGVMVVESARKTVQHLDGGFVEKIYVREGDSVKAGQVLVELDDTEMSAQLEMARSRLFNLLAEEARLVAERDGQEAITFPEALNARMMDERVHNAVHGQERLFETRGNALQGEKNVLKQRVQQLEEQIRGLEALIQSKNQRTALYQEEIDAFNQLFDKGFSDNAKLREWERLVAEIEGEQAEQRSAIAAAKVQITETELQIAQLDRNFHTEVAERLRDVQPELADVRERIRALTRTVERTEIRAPVSGSIVGLTVHTEGGIVEPRQKILDIIPKEESLIIEAKVSPSDIDRVYPGLEADIRFSTFKQSNTPTIIGTVLTVSGDRIEDEATGQPYFLARVRVNEESMDELKDQELLPGMPADVMIKTGERTLLAYLTKPITDRLATAFKED